MSAFSAREMATLKQELAAAGAAPAGSLALAAELEAEAAVEFAVAFDLGASEFELGAEGQAVRSPWRFAVAGPGPALRGVHESPDAVELVSELAGVAMEPTKASYLYFRDEADFIGFHTDVPSCEVVLLLGITAEHGELVVYPEFEHSDPRELLELCRATRGAPEGGLPLPVESGRLVALTGRRVPHRTPQAPRSRPVVQASLCYASGGGAL